MAIQREKVEQQNIVQLAQSVQGKVYVLGTRRGKVKCPTCGTWVQEYQGTKQTAGISDLVMLLPTARYAKPGTIATLYGPCLLFFEVKSETGRLSPEQRAFRDLVVSLGIERVEHCVGTYDAFIAWLAEHGYVRYDSFPHYRQPKAVNQ